MSAPTGVRPSGALRARQRPVRRRAALAGLAVAALLVTGLVVFVETLRHPLPSAPPGGVQEPEADPRRVTSCPDPARDPAEVQPGAGPPTAAGGEPPRVTSNVLYDCPRHFDGVRVRYTGEVVGGLLRRSEGVWTQLNDDVYAGEAGPLPAHPDFRGGNAGVGVLLPAGAAEGVVFVGGPRARGDLLTVTGTFHRIDPASTEVAVIRAETVELTRRGEPIEQPRLPARRYAAYAAVLLAAALTVAERLARQRE